MSSDLSKIAQWVRYLALHNGDGVNKSSSGIVFIRYDNTKMYEDIEKEVIYVQVQGYEILDWSRYESFGPFDTEEQAVNKLVKELSTATNRINEERVEMGLKPLDIRWDDSLIKKLVITHFEEH